MYLKKFKFVFKMQPSQSELEAFLFSAPEAVPQKSPIQSKFPNPSNKTGEDLQELIEEIPYPTEDLSLTSFSNSSSNTNALRRPKPSQKAFYTSFGSDHKENKTPIHIKFERYQNQQQKEESFDEEDDLSNLPNFESLTPHRITQIMDWSKQHVTPGDSKHIFPQVIAPSIEFSHETSAYLSKCVLTEQNEGNEGVTEYGKEKNPKVATHKENKRPVGLIKENGSEIHKPTNLIKKFDEKQNKEERPYIYEEKFYGNEDRSHTVERVHKKEEKLMKSQTQYQKPEERNQRFADDFQRFQDFSQLDEAKSHQVDDRERPQRFIEKPQRFEEKSHQQRFEEGSMSQRYEEKSQRFEDRSQQQRNEAKLSRPEEKSQASDFKHEQVMENNYNFQESSQRIDFDRMRLFCERLESQCQAKDSLLQKKDQETFTLITKIKEMEEELVFLRESTQENANLELLRGKNLESSRKEGKALRKELEQKQSFINELLNEIESLKHNEMCLQESVEKELGFLANEIEKFKALSQGYKRKSIEMENQLKQTLDQKEIENTDYERKIEAISQGYEEISVENESLKEDNRKIHQELDSYKKKIKAMENEIENLRENNKLLKEKEELMYQGGSNELLKEKSSVEKDLHEEIERLRRAYDKATKELDEYRTNGQPKVEDNPGISINKLLLTEASFGKNESRTFLMNHCDHRAMLESFFLNIGYKEEGSETLEGKSFEDLINLLQSIFNHLQEQFEALYTERNEMADSLAKVMERDEKEEKEDRNSKENGREDIDLVKKLEAEKSDLINDVETFKEEIGRVQEILNSKIVENHCLNEGMQKLKEEITRKNEALEVFETGKKVDNPEILIRNSETFQVLTQKYEESNKKYNELQHNYQEILQNFDDISRKYEETSAKYIEISDKCTENHKEIDYLTKEIATLLTSLEKSKAELSQKVSESKAYIETIEAQSSLIASLNSEKKADSSLIESLQNQAKQLRNEISNIRNENSHLAFEISRAQTALTEKNDQNLIESLKTQINLQKSEITSLKTAESQILENLRNQIAVQKNEISTLRVSDSQNTETLRNQLEIHKTEISCLKAENSKLLSELTRLKADFDTEHIVSESHRMSALDFSKRLEILGCENEDLKELLKQQGDKIEELTKLIAEDLDSKEKLEGLRMDAKDFSEKFIEENDCLKNELMENHRILENFNKENESLEAENKGLREKIEEVLGENERLKQDLSLKNERLRVSEENGESLKEKDRKNIQLFKENKSLSENLRILEENSAKDKQEMERKSKSLNQKMQEVKTLSQSLKEKNEELLEERKKTELMRYQIEDLLKIQNEKKGTKDKSDKENLMKMSSKIKQNDEELKEIKKMFISEKEKLMQRIKEIEQTKEKSFKENSFLKETNRISKEKIALLEKTLLENKENQKNQENSKNKENQKNYQNFWCPEMLSNEETVEMMLELLRRIIGSNVILGAMNENSEIMILLKKLTKVFNNNEWSQDNSKFIKRLI